MEWISALDYFPPDGLEVLICTSARNIDKGYRLDGRWVHRGRADVTHWMTLPELPKGS